MVFQGLGIRKMPPGLNTVELATTRKFIVVIERDGLSSLVRFFYFVLNLVNVLLSVAQPDLPLVLFILAPGTVLCGRLARTHD